ncbi:MAG TPA: hypothetical protein VFG47_11530 [Geminicoccaceae bacterium]|nr:hypothetical protein [Geminicoccaceae bacterium]
MPLTDKVAFLSRPDAYPERPRRVEPVETHMSWVFLTDRHAYKLKKPVRYDFLDFSTLEARRRDCADEVRLNRRLAPGVYLGTVPLTADAAGRLHLGGAGLPVEWLVRMRRLPAERTLDRVLRNGTADPDELRAVLMRLCRFYAAAPPVALAPADYRRRFEDDVRANLRELTRPDYGGPPRQREAPSRVAAAQLDFLARRGDLLEARAREGRIVEAHGDLRPEHVYLLDPEPVIVDCLEFNRDFRLLDPADELAYLAVECDRLGAPEVGRLAFEIYRGVTGDAPPEALVAFYRSCRACLRAKIALWHLDEPPVRTPERWLGMAGDYLALAEQYVRGFA